MSRQEPLTYGPEHQVCKVNVEAPTICIDERDGSICVQWFGYPERELPPDVEIPDDAQFLFALLVAKNDPRFALHTEGYMVPFLAPAKDWPAKPDVVQRMIDGSAEGDENKWLLWGLNPRVRLEGDQCPSFCVGIACLGDPNCGIIIPQPFVDLGVRDKAMTIFESI